MILFPPQRWRRMGPAVFAGLLLGTLAAKAVLADDFFRIRVVDAQTGRGVPLVELETVNHIRRVTDSNGWIAFDEPGLVGQRVFFYVRSHGYEYPADGFGFRGRALQVVPGGSATLKVERRNLAERLYRVTGAGIYRDSVLLAEPSPISHPLINAGVLGSDSVVNALFGGKIYWFWGDTNRASYPLGNFHVPGAVSELPARGGLDPAVGIELNYFVDDDGFAKETCRMPGKGPTWIGGLTVVRDVEGTERMFASYVKIRPPLTVYERGLVEFDAEAEAFRHVATFPQGAELYPQGHPFVFVDSEVGDPAEFVYFPQPLPWVRVRATAEAVQDLSQYECWTCLADGQGEGPEVQRDAAGKLVYRWRRGGIPLTPKRAKRLIEIGALRPDEDPFVLRDAQSEHRLRIHSTSIAWNEHRSKWAAIVLETFGSSMLGEIWYAESDRPEGPWTAAVKIVTHERYSFYNPKQHPMLAQDGGRIVYFEGTYTTLFSGNDHPTPRYDYNQIMYRIDLGDPRVQQALEALRRAATPSTR